jgi:septum formation protein
MRIILASASTSRTRLLSEAKIPHQVEVSGVNEESEEFAQMTPARMVVALSAAKAQAIATKHTGENLLVIGADSTLEFEGVSMGKPVTEEIALSWWRNYVGKSGLLHTGQTVIDVARDISKSALSTTEITFAQLSEEEIRSYIATNEPLQLAGGASLDGIGSPYISHISGDATGVLGLSMNDLRRLCEELGHPWRSLRAS